MEALLTNPVTLYAFAGVFLIIMSIIGGGLELKELKVPKIGWFARVISGVFGIFFLLMAFGSAEKPAAPPEPTAVVANSANQSSSSASPSPEAPNQIANTGNQPLKVDYLEKQPPKIQDESGFSESDKQLISALIINADIAEIEAVYYQDTSYLTTYYHGDALEKMERVVEQVKQSGYIVLQELDPDRSYYSNMRWAANGVLAVDQCEYWRETYYDGSTGNVVSVSDWQLVPQTINIELVNDNAFITSISFYSGNAFCTR